MKIITQKIIGTVGFGFVYYQLATILKKYWTYNPQIYNDQQYLIWTLVFTQILVYIISNLYYVILYYLEIPYVEQFRLEKKSWMWKENPQKFWTLLEKTLKNFILNLIIGLSVSYISSRAYVPFRLDQESLPSNFEILWQFILSLVVEDFTFYWTHRILHHPNLYPIIHKQHHEYQITASFAAQYAHPIEYIFGNAFPTMLGPNILGKRMHIVSLIIWLTFRIFKTHHGHSGYVLPWEPFDLIPYGGYSDFHSFHHNYNTGNYATTFTFFDAFFKTDIEYNKMLKERKIITQWKYQ